MPIDVRMGVPPPVTNFDGLSVTLIETQRKAAINATYQSVQDSRKLEDWLEMPHQRFVMFGSNLDAYNIVVGVKYQLS
jgi:hypothetical protein